MDSGGAESALIAHRLYLEVSSVQDELDLNSAARAIEEELASNAAGQLIQHLTGATIKGAAKLRKAAAKFNENYTVSIDRKKVLAIGRGEMQLTPKPGDLIPIKVKERPKIISQNQRPRVNTSHPDLPIRRWLRDRTHGIFNDKKRLMSGRGGGDALEVFRSRIRKLSKSAKISLKHVEGHAVAEMVKSKLKVGVVHINKASGPCKHCIKGIPKLLGDGQKLWVVFQNGIGYFTNQGWNRL